MAVGLAKPPPPFLSLLLRMSLEAALPEILVLAQMLSHPPRQHEEQITQAIYVLERPVSDGLDARKRQDPALGSPAHRPRLVEEAADDRKSTRLNSSH